MLEAISTALMIVFLALPIVSAMRLILNKTSSYISWGIWFSVCSLICYFLFLVCAKLTDTHLKAKLYSYDLDGDGMFSGAELTPQMQQAMIRFTSDTSRTFAPITGLITSPIYCGFWHILMGVLYILVKINDRKITDKKPSKVIGDIASS
jgi:hypothetical protein